MCLVKKFEKTITLEDSFGVITTQTFGRPLIHQHDLGSVVDECGRELSVVHHPGDVSCGNDACNEIKQFTVERSRGTHFVKKLKKNKWLSTLERAEPASLSRICRSNEAQFALFHGKLLV